MPLPDNTRKGKNIVLCSDGTGNSAGVVAITNVRRLYQALDLSNPSEQVAFYDDGVGSGGSKTVRILGGIFGIGLARNVRQLYRFLCDTYQPNDRIYLFGFSRGAFTVRVLAAVIANCGIVNRRYLADNDTMTSVVALAYRCFRGNHEAGLLSRPFRSFRNLFTSTPTTAKDFRSQYSHKCDENIEVLGLWDTVSAYGMPFDELAGFVNKFIYQIRFQSQKISGKIRYAYHALALDDERRTFTPLLIHSVEPPSANTHVEQVWFAGMHSDVGGGYANCNLALVPLEWMIAHTENAGLLFRTAAVEEIRSQASILGEMHDSRSGLGRIYRPTIRDLGRLCERAANSRVADPNTPVVHSGTVERIARGIQGYAPAAIPKVYYDSTTLKKATHATCDVKTLDGGRRVLYFGQLVALAGLLNTEGGRGALAWAIGGLPKDVPRYFAFQNDELLWLGALGLFWWAAAVANRKIQAVAAAAWKGRPRSLATAPAAESSPPSPVADEDVGDANRASQEGGGERRANGGEATDTAKALADDDR